jgi:hypothetical protein
MRRQASLLAVEQRTVTVEEFDAARIQAKCRNLRGLGVSERDNWRRSRNNTSVGRYWPADAFLDVCGLRHVEAD